MLEVGVHDLRFDQGLQPYINVNRGLHLCRFRRLTPYQSSGKYFLTLWQDAHNIGRMAKAYCSLIQQRIPSMRWMKAKNTIIASKMARSFPCSAGL